MSEIKREQVLMGFIAGRGPAFLRGINLSSMDLSNAGWLIDADLRYADLSNTNLRRANLRGANLECANLHSANLLGANLEGANLPEVKANVANFNVCNLRGANLKNISLVGASLIRADLEEADLDGADLEGANFQRSNLRKARLTNVNLKMADMEGSDLAGVILDESAIGYDLPQPGPDQPAEQDFHGTITSIKLTDLIQLGCLSRSNIDIEVISNSDKGNIYIGSGRVLHAQTGSTLGEEALLKILGWENGQFTTYPYTPGDVVSIDKPVEHLLIQSFRLKDENRFAEKYAGFLRSMKELLPLDAYPSEYLATIIEKKGNKLDTQEKIQVTDIFYSDDREEIFCSVSARGDMFIAPLKYINLDRNHPLFTELAELQSEAAWVTRPAQFLHNFPAEPVSIPHAFASNERNSTERES
jgi:uncharacterized protein YjbI with pentapeptide repeats